METFLGLVAQDLLHRFGNDMRDLTVVFPNKRAGLFLTEELQALSQGRPIWAPRFTTLGDLFLSLSPYTVADPIETIVRLHQHYLERILPAIDADERAEAEEHETLDRFWGWGEIILSDFDDIDKHLADARQVLLHAQQLDELNDLTYLTDEQRQLLKRFFGYFSNGEDSKVRRRFLQLWNQLFNIYSDLRSDLLCHNQLWEGALQREVCQRIKADPTIAERLGRVAFVGFSLLNPVDIQLMKALSSQALFYWDYDEYYLNNPHHEAGQFMQQNLRLFPSALPAEHFDNLSRLRHITLVSTSTDSATARYASHWDSESTPRNAIVLCNEQLLLPLLHALPEHHYINITMGFPLVQTPVYSFLAALLTLHTEGWDPSRETFRYTHLQRVMSHPYATLIPSDEIALPCPDLATLLAQLIRHLETIGMAQARETTQSDTPTENQDTHTQSTVNLLHSESIYQSHRLLLRFHRLLTDPHRPLTLQSVTLRRLILTALRTATIPFHGEPATGLQVMGLLETRCLNFTNLLLLSVEEDQMPRPTQTDTILPAVVRQAHGLTTPRHRSATFAYHFYRLIQRTQNLTILYNTNTAGNRRHEPSRYILQLLSHLPAHRLSVTKIQLQNTPHIATPAPIVIHKTPQMLHQLLSDYTTPQHPLSPTALNTYLRCPLQFYWRYIRHLRPDDTPPDEIDPLQLGNIFHDAAQTLYIHLTHTHQTTHIEAHHLRPLTDEPSLRPFVHLAFQLNIFKPLTDQAQKTQIIRQTVQSQDYPHPHYQGQQLILRDVVTHYLRTLVRHDLRHTPFTLLSTETDITFPLRFQADSTTHTIQLGGRADRIDRQADGALRILDYKTGTPHSTLPTLEAAFATDLRQQPHTLQALLYALAVLRSHSHTAHTPIHTALLYMRSAVEPHFDPTLRIASRPGTPRNADIRPLAHEFEEHLRQLLAEICTLRKPFTPTPHPQNCRQCPFASLCQTE